jgi:hypothetical protein
MTQEQFNKITKEGRDKADEFYKRMPYETKWDFQCALGDSSLTMEDFKVLVTGCFEQGYIDGRIIDEVLEVKKPTKRKRFKKWLYNICDTLGIAGSFGGFNI